MDVEHPTALHFAAHRRRGHRIGIIAAGNIGWNSRARDQRGWTRRPDRKLARAGIRQKSGST